MSQTAMRTSEILSDDDLVDINRSRMYYLLALGFSFPGEQLQKLQTELWELARALYPGEDFRQMKVNVLDPEFESCYITTLDGHKRGDSCSLYESAWKKSDKAKCQWEVKNFYKFFGLQPGGKTMEMPDHITSELEFMHYLSHQAVSAGTCDGQGINQREHYIHAQKDFLERHLGQWGPTFCKAFEQTVGEPFYTSLGRLTARFLLDDLEWVREQYASCELMPSDT